MDTGMRGSLNLKYFLYMIKTTHFSDEPKKIGPIGMKVDCSAA